jgi:hypothetical protein
MKMILALISLLVFAAGSSASASDFNQEYRVYQSQSKAAEASAKRKEILAAANSDRNFLLEAIHAKLGSDVRITFHPSKTWLAVVTLSNGTRCSAEIECQAVSISCPNGHESYGREIPMCPPRD